MLVPIILGVLVLSVASGLKICEDCVNLNDCMPATDLTAIKESEMTEAMLNSALCGSDGEGKIKVCCSDITAIREIVNHTNLHLLPNECGKVENNSYTPWIANIYYKRDDRMMFACVGTFINSRYVLTTADCLKYSNIVGVRICSDLDCDNNYQKIGVANLSIHEGFNSRSRRSINHDIGLLRLKKTVNMSSDNAGAICLPVSVNHWQYNLFGTIATASGWGTGIEEYNETNYHSFQQTVPIYNPEMCEKIARRSPIGRYKKEDKTKLCAGGISPDKCRGSAGSALMVEGSGNGNNRYVQYGILSYGSARCDVNRPEFYTDVRSHMKWILDNIEE